jgi:flavin reductase (DIM6/NTAB) family NADH-FMN oxidoreductase RutF
MLSFPASDMEEIQFPQTGTDAAFRLLQDGVGPKPVFLIGTTSAAGMHNVAPYSYISPAATTPPSLVISFP